MPARRISGFLRTMRSGRLVLAALLVATLAGCRGPSSWFTALKGEGFPEWSNAMGTGVRGGNDDVKPSGFFTDRRSEQIEKNLGGGF